MTGDLVLTNAPPSGPGSAPHADGLARHRSSASRAGALRGGSWGACPSRPCEARPRGARQAARPGCARAARRDSRCACSTSSAGACRRSRAPSRRSPPRRSRLSRRAACTGACPCRGAHPQSASPAGRASCRRRRPGARSSRSRAVWRSRSSSAPGGKRTPGMRARPQRGTTANPSKGPATPVPQRVLNFPQPSCRPLGTAASRVTVRPFRREGAEMKQAVTVTVNGVSHTTGVEPRTLLVHFLREQLNLTGTHVGCDTSNCGACTVWLDGEAVKSCTVFAVQADGHEVTTIEGISDGEALHPMQRAFHEQHGLQCGYCTPGMVMTAIKLLEQNPHPTDEEIRHGLEGNLCRCTGYENIVGAVRAASAGVPA